MRLPVLGDWEGDGPWQGPLTLRHRGTGGCRGVPLARRPLGPDHCRRRPRQTPELGVRKKLGRGGDGEVGEGGGSTRVASGTGARDGRGWGRRDPSGPKHAARRGQGDGAPPLRRALRPHLRGCRAGGYRRYPERQLLRRLQWARGRSRGIAGNWCRWHHRGARMPRANWRGQRRRVGGCGHPGLCRRKHGRWWCRGGWRTHWWWW